MVGASLLAAKKMRIVLGALAITGIQITLITAFLGTAWIPDYFHLVSHYDRDTADAYFRDSLVPQRMSNLRQVLYVEFGLTDSRSSTASNAAWLLASLSALVWSVRRKQTFGLPEAISLLIFPYCLFAQHLSFTEDLILALPVWLLWSRCTPGIGLISWLLLMFILAANGLMSIPSVMTLAFLAKATLAGLFLFYRPTRRLEKVSG
jgi:hypothetical protein